MNHPGPFMPLFIAAFIAADILVVYVIIRAMMRNSWDVLTRRFPFDQPAPDALTRRFQSFKLGILNLGWSIHVTVDAEHLHLRPAWFCRRLGMTPVSIPWDDITFLRRLGRSPYATARIAGLTMTGPMWCFSLADNDTPDTDALSNDADEIEASDDSGQI